MPKAVPNTKNPAVRKLGKVKEKAKAVLTMEKRVGASIGTNKATVKKDF